MTAAPTLALLLALSVFRPSSALADEAGPQQDPATPWVLSSNNWQLGEKLLPPPVLERVKNGDYSAPPGDVEAVKNFRFSRHRCA